MAKIEFRSVTVADREVALSEKAGAPLVLLTRLASAGPKLWGGFATGLAQHCSVAIVSHSAPTGEEAKARLARYADEVAEVATALGAPAFHLVGWNGGAQIGLETATRHADRLRSLTLLAPFRRYGETRQIDKGLEFLELFMQSGRRDLYTWHWFLAGFSDEYIARNFDFISGLVADRLANDRFVSLDTERAMAWMRALRQDHVTDEELRALAVPLLAVGPGRNRWHAGPNDEMARRIASLVPGARHMTAASCGAHFPIENPQPALAAVLEMIGSTESSDYQ